MKLEKKQKVLITLIIIALAYVAWQVYDMFSGGSSNQATTIATPVTAQPSLQLQPAVVKTTTPQIPAITPTTPVMTAPASSMTIQPTPVTTAGPMPAAPMQQLTVQAPLSSGQNEYLRLVNRYEVVKMRRMVVEEEASIAAAKAKIAQLNLQTQKITGNQPGQAVFGRTPITGNYQLMYIDYQNGRWTATLNRNGRFHEVHEGMILSNGDRIIKITQKGVIIQKGSSRYLLTFSGMSLLRNTGFYSNPQPYGIQRINPVMPKPKTTHKPKSCVVVAPAVIAPTPAAAKKPDSMAPIRYTPPSVPPKVESSPKIISPQPTTMPSIPSSENTLKNSNPGTKTTPAVPLILQSAATPTTTKSSSTSTNTLASQVAAPTTPHTNSFSASASTTTSITTNEPSKKNNAPHTDSFSIVQKTNASPSIASAVKPQTDAANLNANTFVIDQQPDSQTKPALAQSQAALTLTPAQKDKVVQIESMVTQQNQNSDPFSNDEKHLLSLPGDHYTLQLMGSNKLSELTNFIKEANLQEAFTYHTYYLNKDWYVLIYGIYRNNQEAMAAIKNLPLSAQQLKPWVRTIASVQYSIKLNPSLNG